jgi:hypothetical protein
MAHQLAKHVKKCRKTTPRHRVQTQFELREVSSTLKSTIFNRETIVGDPVNRRTAHSLSTLTYANCILDSVSPVCKRKKLES